MGKPWNFGEMGWNVLQLSTTFHYLGATFTMFTDYRGDRINVYCDAFPKLRPLCSLDMNYAHVEKFVRQNKIIRAMLIGQTL